MLIRKCVVDGFAYRFVKTGKIKLGIIELGSLMKYEVTSKEEIVETCARKLFLMVCSKLGTNKNEHRDKIIRVTATGV